MLGADPVRPQWDLTLDNNGSISKGKGLNFRKILPPAGFELKKRIGKISESGSYQSDLSL
jgi:hypothetical protein